jgi:sirohydrochlorin cobaltochelatase
MVIFIAHGSRNASWRGSVEALIESVQAELGPDRVRLAYMECTPPTLMDAAADAVAAGATSIRVVPLFLAGEGHVDRNIRPLIDRLRERFGRLEVDLVPPVGRHRLFKELLCAIAREAPP